MARWQNQPNTEKREQVISLRMSGMTYKQIANAIGHKNESWVVTVCRENGLGGTSAWKDKRYAEMREYKSQGHTIAEVAELFGVSDGTASRVCKGVAPQKTDYSKVSNTLKEYNERNRKHHEQKLIEQLDDKFEYVCGYDGKDGYVTIRCKDCGTEFERSVQSIRKKYETQCPECRKRETEANNERREREREQRNAEREVQKAERERKAQELIKAKAERIVTRRCVICCKEFETAHPQRKCCSEECSRILANRRHDRRIPYGKRNHAINARSLYKRDNGVCWICGGKCNLDDYVIVDGTFIAGDWYPSVDHIKPVYQGGEDAWENVKLAHRRCNIRRYIDEK